MEAPRIFLSPSTQPYNKYPNGGDEQYWMNRITDAMIPYLTASGIEYSRNTPDTSVGTSIRDFSGCGVSRLAGASGAEGKRAVPVRVREALVLSGTLREGCERVWRRPSRSPVRGVRRFPR